MARQQDDVMDGLRREFKRQLRGFPREAKRQLTGFGREAAHQLGSGWREEFGRTRPDVPQMKRPAIITGDADLAPVASGAHQKRCAHEESDGPS
jgi:hypothetical protein